MADVELPSIDDAKESRSFALRLLSKYLLRLRSPSDTELQDFVKDIKAGALKDAPDDEVLRALERSVKWAISEAPRPNFPSLAYAYLGLAGVSLLMIIPQLTIAALLSKTQAKEAIRASVWCVIFGAPVILLVVLNLLLARVMTKWVAAKTSNVYANRGAAIGCAFAIIAAYPVFANIGYGLALPLAPHREGWMIPPVGHIGGGNWTLYFIPVFGPVFYLFLPLGTPLLAPVVFWLITHVTAKQFLLRWRFGAKWKQAMRLQLTEEVKGDAKEQTLAVLRAAMFAPATAIMYSAIGIVCFQILAWLCYRD